MVTAIAPYSLFAEACRLVDGGDLVHSYLRRSKEIQPAKDAAQFASRLGQGVV
jgi:hypothetical protein